MAGDSDAIVFHDAFLQQSRSFLAVPDSLEALERAIRVHYRVCHVLELCQRAKPS